MEKRVFSGKVMRMAEQELLGAMPTDRDQNVAAVVREAMNRVNYATANITTCARRIRRDLDEVMEQVDGGYSVRQIGSQSPADLREAIKMREDYFSVLTELLGPDLLAQYLKASADEYA
jgi:hypothetical protein